MEEDGKDTVSIDEKTFQTFRLAYALGETGIKGCGSGHLAAVELTTGIDPHRSPS